MDLIRNILVCVVLYAVSSGAAPQSAFGRRPQITTEVEFTTPSPFGPDDESTDDVRGMNQRPTPTEMRSSTDSFGFGFSSTDATEMSTSGGLTGRLKCAACKLISASHICRATINVC
uniref:Uncharacterized protein n=1 Tax=Plectus sambesii TaxID=2011161 RepID=A0A914XKT8_9BILA